jgi:hypothetical protein
MKTEKEIRDAMERMEKDIIDRMKSGRYSDGELTARERYFNAQIHVMKWILGDIK